MIKRAVVRSKLILGLCWQRKWRSTPGGPFNKAAYVFGTAAIASGNYDVMAAVMIGGMTPPCASALATMLFKKKFTKEEREAGPTNFIMGLAFITEERDSICSVRSGTRASSLHRRFGCCGSDEHVI